MTEWHDSTSGDLIADHVAQEYESALLGQPGLDG